MFVRELVRILTDFRYKKVTGYKIKVKLFIL